MSDLWERPVARRCVTVPAEPAAALVVPASFIRRSPRRVGIAGQARSRVPLVILNIHNGQGSGPEAPFKDVTECLRGAGVPVISYVDADYGIARGPGSPRARPVPQLVRRQRRVLDRAATSAAKLACYAALSARVRKLGAGVVFFNHGAYPDEGYARHADLLGAFEGPWPAYRTLNVPRWTTAWPSEKFYHVVYSVPPERSEEAARLAMKRHAAAVYITERGGSNPYDRLPVVLRA